MVLALAFTSRGEAKEDYTHHAPHNTQIAEQPSPIAILSNPQNNYRFGSSRPQRILPVYAQKQQRGNGKVSATHFLQQILKCHVGIVEDCLSASFMPDVSCKDVFLVLRHIIR